MATSNRRPPERTPAVTHEGGAAVIPGLFEELALTLASTYFGEDTFYERASERETRLVDLVHRATQRDPHRTATLIGNNRHNYKIRTASLVAAVEYVRAGGPNGRAVISSVVGRPDEPTEILAYWQSRYGAAGAHGLANLPWALKRGVADAITRVFTERNVLKYNGGGRKLVTMADAIAVTHPEPKAEWQSALFRWVLDDAHHGDAATRYIAARQDGGVELPTMYTSYQMGQIPEEARRSWVREHPVDLADAGYTWERLSGWLPGGMDAEAWEAVIPHMGVMALLRNLRNFDQAGISENLQKVVEDRITSPTEVAKSRIFPYRVYSAYREAPSDRWRYPLGKTLDLSAGNVPRWDRTLFLVDASGSMGQSLSNKGTVNRMEVASLMAGAAVARSHNSKLGMFATGYAEIEGVKGISTLRMVEEMVAFNGRGDWMRNSVLGHGTNGHTAINALFNPTTHDRVVVFTDDQMHDNAALSKHVPKIVYFNLAGYAPMSDWASGRVHVGGFADATFALAADLTAS